jgi:hypothetical protein
MAYVYCRFLSDLDKYDKNSIVTLGLAKYLAFEEFNE